MERLSETEKIFYSNINTKLHHSTNILKYSDVEIIETKILNEISLNSICIEFFSELIEKFTHTDKITENEDDEVCLIARF